MGRADTIVGAGVVVDWVQYRDSELDVFAEFSYSHLSSHTPCPFRLQFEQYKLLELLRTHCGASVEVDVRCGHKARPTVFSHDAAGTPRVHQCDLMVAADGASSGVREWLAIDFEGKTYSEENTILGTGYDTTTVGKDLPPVSYLTSPYGKLSVIRTPGHRPMALTLPGPSDVEDPSEAGPARLGARAFPPGAVAA